MGMNHILSRLNALGFENVVSRVSRLPERFNLAVDYTLFLVPLLKMARDMNDLLLLFDSFFDQQTAIRNVFVQADQVLICLDYYYPAMKRETCQQRRRQRQQETTTTNTTPTSTTTSCFTRRPTATTTTTTSPASPSTASNQDEIKTTTTTCYTFMQKRNFRNFHRGSMLSSVNENVNGNSSSTGSGVAGNSMLVGGNLRLKDVRPILSRMFLRNFSRENVKFVFRIDDTGEGEIKCLNFHDWHDSTLPLIIMSNDNDVSLIATMQTMQKQRRRNNFNPYSFYYRLSLLDVNDLTCFCRPKANTVSFAKLHFVLQKISPFSFSSTLCSTSSSPCSGTSLHNLHDSLSFFMTVVALYGTDYVRPLSLRSNIIKTYANTYGWRCFDVIDNSSSSSSSSSPSSSSSILTSSSSSGSSTSIGLLRVKLFEYMIRLFARLVDIDDEITENEIDDNTVTYNRLQQQQQQQQKIDDDVDSFTREYVSTKRLTVSSRVYTWCMRVYWNFLYYTELPVCFSVDNRFDKDANVHVNLSLNSPVIDMDDLRFLERSNELICLSRKLFESDMLPLS